MIRLERNCKINKDNGISMPLMSAGRKNGELKEVLIEARDR